MNPKPNFPIYLGDGAFITEDEYGGIVIYTSNGIDVTNQVVFESFGMVELLTKILTDYINWGMGPKDD